MSQHPTPVFILGSGRSGTTITASLLSHLPRVQFAKETGYISQNLPLLRDIDNPGSLKRLVGVVNQWLTRSNSGNLASPEGFDRFCSQYAIQGASAFIHYVWQLDSPKPWHELSFIGDNTPLYVLAIPAIQALMPDARFIHMIRDPRDVVTSMLTMRFGANDPLVAAMDWHIMLGSWLMAERIVAADRRIECRYEDLCAMPEQTVARLARFLNHTDADATAALVRQSSIGSKLHTGFEKVAVASHHTRLIEPLAPNRVGRFKTELTSAQIQAIEEIAQDGMLAYGYKLTGQREHPLLRENRIRILRAVISDFTRRCYKHLRRR